MNIKECTCGGVGYGQHLTTCALVRCMMAGCNRPATALVHTRLVRREGDHDFVQFVPMKHADISTIYGSAYQAYQNLCASGFAEFGEETQQAIIDTAGDDLTDAGYKFDRDELVRIAKGMA